MALTIMEELKEYTSTIKAAATSLHTDKHG
jgi:hypothetical protein